MKLCTILYTLLLATLLVGCGDSPSMRQLNDLEARINDAPDSVLRVLTATDMPRWGERRALHALLTVQAQDKKGLNVANDSLIRVATRYYDHRGLPLRRLQAFYYHGRVHANAGLHHEAMTAYTRAKDFVPEVNAPYPVGLLYAQMSVLYGNDYDYQRALESMQEALRYYELAGKERLQYIAKRNIGLIYLNMQDAAQADSLLNEVLVWGEAHENVHIIYSVLTPLLRLYDATTNVEALDSLLMRYPTDVLPKNAVTYGIIARSHALKGDETKAEESLAQAWRLSKTAHDTAMLWQKKNEIYKALDAPYIALQSYERLLLHQDSVVRITLRQPLIASQLSHYQNRLEIEELSNLNYRYLLGIAALLITVVAVIVWMFYREAFRKKEAQIKQYMNTADQLRITLYEKEEELGRAAITLQQRIVSLFKEQYNLLDELCTTYYENPKDEQRSKHIFEKVKSVIDTFSSDEGYTKLEAIVNESRHNVITLLRSELPKFKETDYRLLCYFCAGLSVQTISLFTKEEPEKLWVYKGRLIARIAKSDAPNKEIILEQIPQRIRKS